MPPPPSQKGKFKPRKPAKKIRPGVSAGAPVETSSAAGIQGPVSGGRGGRMGGRGGRDGRGRVRGRSGRGRGRGPLPQGKVFFTAAPKTATAASRKRTVVVSRIKNNESDPTEEVVGQLDNAIGSSVGKKSEGIEKESILDSMDYEDYDEGDGQGAGGRGRGSVSVEAFTYESDSSQEEERHRRRAKPTSLLPLELPFPAGKLPLGIGAGERPVMYECQDPQAVTPVSDPSMPANTKNIPKGIVSPFVDTQRKDDLRWEQNSWFLVQFPTRLPPLQQNIQETLPADGDDEVKEESTATAEGIPMPTIADVATPPIVANSFDNSLSNATPGRLGKLVVYKSGKTVLVMEGPDGSHKIRMNVTEGLSCGFLQQAVAIDTEQGTFATLGKVGKSIVVSPDLQRAFPTD